MKKRKKGREVRSRYEITLVILETTETKDGADKKSIRDKTNLSFEEVEKYLEYLLEEGFIEETEPDIFIITKRGRDFLKRIKKLRDILK